MEMEIGADTLSALRAENQRLHQHTIELEARCQQVEEELQRLRTQEEKLHERSWFLQNLMDHLPVSVFVKDVRTWQFVLWNKAMAQIVGLTEEEVLGKTDYDFFPPDQADFFRQKDSQTVERGTPEYIAEEPVNSPTLGTRLLRTVKVPTYDATGKPLYLLGISEDITDRKHADEELRTFKILIEHAPDGIMFTDINRIITYANPAAQAIFGYGENLVGLHISTLYADSEKERQPVILQTIREQGLWQGTLTYRRQDGHHSICQASAFLLRHSDGTLRGNAIIVRDISELKRTEKRLLNFQAMVEYAPDGIALINLDRTVAYTNTAMCDMLRLHPERLVGQDTRPLFADPPEYLEQMRAHYLTHGTWTGTVTMRRSDSTTFTGQSSVFVIYDSETNTPQKLAVILRDMTEQQQVAEKLRLREAILEVVGSSAEHFLRTGDIHHNIQAMLEQLGNAVQVSRVYLFENHTDDQGTLMCSQRYEWAAPGIEPQLDNPDLQGVPYLEGGLERWSKVLQQGQSLYGNVATFPDSERELLASQDIRAIIVVPIFMDGVWWGYLGFDDCECERDWSAVEIDALKAAVSIIGSAIQRRQDEERQNALQQQIIEAQRATLHELSAPLLPISDHLVLMPLIGTIDTQRAQQVVETLLDGVARHHADTAIVDITGVQVVDTQVANALIQAAQTVKLLGARVMLTGIGPTMAQTLVSLGADLKSIVTYGSLQSAVVQALSHRQITSNHHR